MAYDLDYMRRCLRNPLQDKEVLAKELFEQLSEIYESQNHPYIFLKEVVYPKQNEEFRREFLFKLSNDKGDEIYCRYDFSGRRLWAADKKENFDYGRKRTLERLGVTEEYLCGLEMGIALCKNWIEREQTSRKESEDGLIKRFTDWTGITASRISKAIKQLPFSLQNQDINSLKLFDGDIGCVYFLIHKTGKVLYVGSTKNLNKRIESHRRDKFFERVLYFETSLTQMRVIENIWIKKLNPPLNKR